MSEKKRDPITKVFAALSWIITQGQDDISLKEIAAGVGLPLSTTHRVMSSLCETGFIRQDATGRYRLGLELVRIARIAVASAPLPRVGLPHLNELVRQCDETALLFQYDQVRQQLVTVGVVESTKPIRYVFSLRDWLPIHAGASGLAILSFLRDDEREVVLRRFGLPKITDRTITDYDALAREIVKTRERGYAISAGQTVVGAVGISTPIYASGGTVVGGVSLTIPESRFEPRDEGTLSSQLLECAKRISRDLGEIK